MSELQHLIAEAVRLGGGDLCAAGHEWQEAGGRACPHGEHTCSQVVSQCARCGVYDYGAPGTPGRDWCDSRCRHGHREFERRSRR